MTQTKSNQALANVADTIVACCTATGSAALALIRISGAQALVIAAQAAHLANSKNLADAPSHTISYGSVVNDNGDPIDKVLFMVMSAPRTFTGYDTVEITCHNNPFLIDAIIERLCALGARFARPGEFTQCAVENGKMDLLQAEALHDLITAPSRALAQASLAQLDGSLSHVIREVEAELVTLAGFAETSFEFSEEEHMDFDFDAMVASRFLALREKIKTMLDGQSSIAHLREGVRIALVGSVNAGKSTLLNALLGKKRAIVSAQAGTTRDSIEASMSDGRYSWTFIDTAGLRETADVIEQEGIKRSHEAAKGADLVLIVIDGSTQLDVAKKAEYDKLRDTFADKALVVVTKADLASTSLQSFVVSAHTGTGIAELKKELATRVVALYEQADTPFVLNQRHLALLKVVQQKLGALQINEQILQYEIIAAQLHEVLSLIVELTGRNVTEHVMDTVFSTFCIGK